MPSHLFATLHILPEMETSPGSGPSTVLLSNATSVRPTKQQPLLEIVYIDTLVMAPREDAATRFGGRHYVSPEEAERYLAEVEAMLAASTAEWLVVAGHYTVYSVADHGDTPYLVKHLAPLLRKYGVIAYFNGHDHVLQHIEHDGVSYFTSGHGTHSDNFPLGSYNARLSGDAVEGYRYSGNGPGFAAVQVTKSTMTVQFIDKTGGVMYTTVFSKPNAYTPGPQSTVGSFSGIAQPMLTTTMVAIIAVIAFALVLVRYANTVRKIVNRLLPASLQVARTQKQSDPHLDAMEKGLGQEAGGPPPVSNSFRMVVVSLLGCVLLWLVYIATLT
jgi:hypothetical protein